MSNLKYHEKQTFSIVWIVCLICICLFLTLSISPFGHANEDSSDMPMVLNNINLVLFSLLFLLFYDMQIKIDDKKLYVKFGIGLFRKDFYSKIQTFKV